VGYGGNIGKAFVIFLGNAVKIIAQLAKLIPFIFEVLIIEKQ
jgi:hypothetical protein